MASVDRRKSVYPKRGRSVVNRHHGAAGGLKQALEAAKQAVPEIKPPGVSGIKPRAVPGAKVKAASGSASQGWAGVLKSAMEQLQAAAEQAAEAQKKQAARKNPPATPKTPRAATKKSGSLFKKLIFFGFIFYLFSSFSELFDELSPGGWEQGLKEAAEQVQWLFGEVTRQMNEPQPDPTAPTPISKSAPRQPAPRMPVAQQQAAPPPAPLPTPAAPTAPAEVDIAIGSGFQASGFSIVAMSDTLPLTTSPPEGLTGKPPFAAAGGQYGRIELNQGRGIFFAMDHRPGGAVMFIDRNGNGNLGDDGEPLHNEGDGYFATKLSLALPDISGIPQLKGEYVLWVYLAEADRAAGLMRFYSMTQLKGQIRLNGKVYDAWIADNQVIDGDYRNDGMYLDLNGDGSVDLATEFVAPGETLKLDGREYRFRMAP